MAHAFKKVTLPRVNVALKAVLLLSFVVTTLCPVAVMGPTQAFGALEITSGQDMGAMPCPVLSCQVKHISTARHDVRQAIYDWLALAGAVAVPMTVIGTEPSQTGAKFGHDRFDVRSPRHIPLYLLYASLIR